MGPADHFRHRQRTGGRAYYFLGLPGFGTTAFDGADGGLAPKVLVAVTVNV